DITFAPATGSWEMPYISGPTICSDSFSNGVPFTALRARVFFSTCRCSPDFLAFDLSCVTRSTSRPRYSATSTTCAPCSLAATSETIACFCSRLRPKVLPPFYDGRHGDLGIRNAVCVGQLRIKFEAFPPLTPTVFDDYFHQSPLLRRERRRIDFHADPHRARHRNFLQKNPFRRGGLRLVQRVEQRGEVVAQLVRRERSAADRALHDAGLVGAELHLAGARVLDRARHVRRHRPDLRVGHQAARSEDLAERTDDAHRLRRGDHHVEVDLARLHLLGEIFHADDVGARRLRGGC